MKDEKRQEKNELGMSPIFNRIFIEEDKEFTLDEFAHLVARAVRSVASVDIDKDEVKYSRDDVYFTIVDMLGYINERTPGRFKIDQTSFQSYLIHYVPDGIAKTRKAKGLLVSKAQSAIEIKASSGSYPVWAENDDALMELIQSIENKPKAAPTAVIPEKTLENRAHVAIQIREREGQLPDWVNDDPRLKEKVEQLIDEEDFTTIDALLRDKGDEDVE